MRIHASEGLLPMILHYHSIMTAGRFLPLYSDTTLHRELRNDRRLPRFEVPKNYHAYWLR